MYLDERMSVSPNELNQLKTADEFQELLLSKLREKMESKCNANGYVRPGSIEILDRTIGECENGRFTGNLLYDCKLKCDVLFPTADSIVDAYVIKVTKMGAWAVFQEAMRILLPRDLHVGSLEFDSIKEGETVKIRLQRSRFQTNDTFIMSVGTLVAKITTE
jgi:DNA-directed RNA polymerase subunit E'/Rpb7